MASAYSISTAEHEANMGQFAMLNPQGGKVSGEAARSVLVKSGLPPAVLGNIWSLSDLDRDGFLDQREFSIAMKLTRNCLSGVPLPPSLPPTLLNVPLSGSMPRPPPPPTLPPMPMGVPPGLPPMPGAYALPGMGVPPGPAPAFPVYHTAPAGMMGGPGGSPAKAPPLPGRPPAAPGASFPGRQLDNWTMPQPNKLKYTQMFNQFDKGRTGFLDASAARNAMGQSGLPGLALAHIWVLSDVNNDGRLSTDEFAIAMWLIEQHKNGFTLPPVLPPELKSLCHGIPGRSDSPATPSGEAPAQKSPAPKTFEDKRRDNLSKGQAEIDRRRLVLQEEEDRRRAEENKKLREAEEKRERERLEFERRREAERQAELERQRQAEEERIEAENKRAAERERQRLEGEKQKAKVALEKRKRDLMSLKSSAAERAATQEQKRKTLAFQLQALDEKKIDLEADVGRARDAIEAITKEIEGMRLLRDEKLKAIADAQTENQQSAVQAEQLAHQLLQLQGANREATVRASELDDLAARKERAETKIEEMKKQVEATRERNCAQQENVAKKRQELEGGLRPAVQRLVAEHAGALARAQEKKRELAAKLRTNAQPAQSAALYDAPPDVSSPSNARSSIPAYDTPPVVPDTAATSNGHHHETSSNGPLPVGTAGSQSTVKYKGIYAFEARSEDELSFQPGDAILVFEGHAAEPGWLAGQIKEKVGWFPASFAEPIAPVNTNASSPMQTVPTNVTPSPSLEKILEEPHSSVPSAAAATNHAVSNNATAPKPPTTNGESTVVCTCVAQFPWKARNAGDLSFAKGDHIEVLERTDMKWRGRKVGGSGETGWFPKSYVKVVDEGRTGSASSGGPSSRQPSVVSAGSATATPTSGSAPSIFPGSGSSHSVLSVIEVGKGGGPPAGPAPTYESPPGDVPNSMYDVPPGTENGELAATPSAATAAFPSAAVGEWYVALFNFDAVESTDLPLHSGDKILVTERNDDWWKGTCNGREGVFPANYVGPSEPPANAAPVTSPTGSSKFRATAIAAFQAAGDNQLSLKAGDVVIVRSKSDAGWWEGEVTDPNGQSRVGWFPGDYVQADGSAAGAPAISSPVGKTFVAAFEYAATQADELSFKAGEQIVVVAQTDSEWWTGHRSTDPTTNGLFPANYLQSCSPMESSSSVLYDVPPPIPTHRRPSPDPSAHYAPASTASSSSSANADEAAKAAKMIKLVEELYTTEEKYHADLILVKKLFYMNLSKALDATTLSKIFLNWDDLIDLSGAIRDRMATGEHPGSVFCAEIDALSAFVKFCSQQTAALEAIERSTEHGEARRVYAACCQNEHAHGLSLSYFLLLPLGRVTRYPLLFEKMLACAVPGSDEQTSLDVALQLLKSLVAEVNLEIRETDNLQLLCWAQRNVRTPGLREKIEFTSNTRNQGLRTFLHSGTLWKARSGRLLIGLLFNDFLLLATPTDHVHDISNYKVARSTDVSLSLYKTPLLTARLSISPLPKDRAEEEGAIDLKYGDDVIMLRASNRNARTLWLKQLEETINVALVANADVMRKGSVVTDSQPSGRLLVEIVGLQHAETNGLSDQPLAIRLSFGRESQVFDVPAGADLTALKLTTQFAFTSRDVTLVMGVYKRRFFAPDLLVFDEGRMPLEQLITESSAHRGPIIKPIPLTTHADGTRTLRRSKETLTVKFVVQMFDNDY